MCAGGLAQAGGIVGDDLQMMAEEIHVLRTEALRHFIIEPGDDLIDGSFQRLPVLREMDDNAAAVLRAEITGNEVLILKTSQDAGNSGRIQAESLRELTRHLSVLLPEALEGGILDGCDVKVMQLVFKIDKHSILGVCQEKIDAVL